MFFHVKACLGHQMLLLALTTERKLNPYLLTFAGGHGRQIPKSDSYHIVSKTLQKPCGKKNKTQLKSPILQGIEPTEKMGFEPAAY